MDKTCRYCKGSGKQIKLVPILRGILTTSVTCSYCKGTGKVEKNNEK